jgi:hypothetical protein
MLRCLRGAPVPGTSHARAMTASPLGTTGGVRLSPLVCAANRVPTRVVHYLFCPSGGNPGTIQRLSRCIAETGVRKPEWWVDPSFQVCERPFASGSVVSD